MHEAIRAKIYGDQCAARLAWVEEARALRHERELRMRARLARNGMSGKQIGRILRLAQRRGLRSAESGITRAMSAITPTRRSPSGVAHVRAGELSSIEPPAGWISEAEARRWNLHHIRKQQMRVEARATFIAYAFLKGRPFEAIVIRDKDGKPVSWNRGVEEFSYEPPPFDRVRNIVAQHTAEDPRVALQRLAEWIDHAGWEKREVMRNVGKGQRGSIGMFWRHKDAEHESYTHRVESINQAAQAAIEHATREH